MRPTAETKGIRLQAVLGNTQNLIWGDARRLQQILWNLLSNALKFTPKNGRVQVTVSRTNSHAEVLVSDTGKGIAPDLLPYVFDRFRQGDGSTKRTYGGLGLGLAIVRHMTELHGGTVTANSAGEGLGATFRVALPLAALREDGFFLGNRSETKAASTGAIASSEKELEGVRILILDDEPDARELIGTVLERSGAEVRMASDAKAAMEVVTGWKPDVLLSDVGMPDQDGYSFIRQVRSLPHKDGGSIPAAALTAYASAKDRLRALTAGFQTHLSKPVEPRELIAVVAVLSGKTGTAKDR
jgi:CheY-like chemotaxis protein